MASRVPASVKPKAPRRRFRKLWITLATGAIVILLGWGYSSNWFGLGAPGYRGPRTAIAVLGFKNLSGNAGVADLSNAFTTGLAEELRAGQGLRVVPGERVAQLRVALQIPTGGSYTRRMLSLIRENTGADFVVSGGYAIQAPSGENTPIQLNLMIQDARSGVTAASFEQNGTTKDLAAVLVDSAAQLRAKLNSAPLSNSEQRFTRAVLPSNSDALLLYANGLDDFYTWKYEAACDLFEKAIAIDSSYPLSHAALARALAARGYAQEAAAEIRQALNLSNKLPREQRLLVEAEYYELEAEPSKALETYKALFKLHPDDIAAGLALAELQKRTEALETLDTLHKQASPLRDDPRIDVVKARIELRSGNYAAARLAAESAVIKARERSAQDILARALTLQAQAERMLGQRQRAAALYKQAERTSAALGDHDTEATCLQSLAAMSADAGELRSAASGYEQALEIGRATGSLAIVASAAGGLGHVRLEQGSLVQAQRYLEQALNVWRQQQAFTEIPIGEIDLGELYLRRGDLQSAFQNIADALKALTNTHGASQVDGLAVLARIRMEQGNLEAASQAISEASQIAHGLSDKYPLARILLLAGSLAREQASFAPATQRYSEAIRLFSGLGLAAGVAEARLGLARLNLDEQNAVPAARFAREALVEFEREDRAGSAILARAVLAHANLLQKSVARAEAVLRPALRQHIQDRLAADLVDIVSARLDAAKGNRSRAIAKLQSLIADTSRLGLVADRLRADLALARIDPQFNTAQLISEASRLGFTAIANQAAALRPAKDARAA